MLRSTSVLGAALNSSNNVNYINSKFMKKSNFFFEKPKIKNVVTKMANEVNQIIPREIIFSMEANRLSEKKINRSPLKNPRQFAVITHFESCDNLYYEEV